MLIQKKPKLFIDMDGTLAEWKTIDIPSQVPTEKINRYINDILYTPNYFYDLKPYMNMVNAVNTILDLNDFDVYILSCVLPYNKNYPNSNPEIDKNRWLNKYFGSLIPTATHRLFVPDGEPKLESIKKLYRIEVTSNDILIDDYTKNLRDWTLHTDSHDKNFLAIKCMNGLNNTKGTWKGPFIHKDDSPDKIVNVIYNLGYKKDKNTEELNKLFSQKDMIEKIKTYYKNTDGYEIKTLNDFLSDLDEILLSVPAVEQDSIFESYEA